MKIETYTRSDLLETSSRLSFFDDETNTETAPELTFEAVKLKGELVEFVIRSGREVTRTFSWSICRATLMELRAHPQVLAMCGTLAAPLICLDSSRE